MKQFGNTILRIILLVFIWFALNLIDFAHVQLTFLNPGDLIGRVLMAVLDVLGLVIILPFCRRRGWSLVWVVFFTLFGVKTFLTVIEAVYLPMLIPLVGTLLVNGLISSLIFTVAAVFLFALFDDDQTNPVPSRVNMFWAHWLWKIPLSSFIWMVLFALFGALVFLNLAGALDPTALAEYSNLDMPVWVLPFQGLRALLWLLLCLPFLAQLQGSKKQLFWRVGLLMACWMGSNLLAANQLPVGLLVAHLVEVFGEAFVFGAWLVLVFIRRDLFSVVGKKISVPGQVSEA